jgi:hypothetical protein
MLLLIQKKRAWNKTSSHFMYSGLLSVSPKLGITFSSITLDDFYCS